ncbi:Uncharacterised protein [Nocardia africana]|uniref:Uncharacterized protein n=1 Tax=Nocardia africana TaxID=134964 RepID=A0A378X6B5_9NOCA|nr:Uncharacterised protein [Nocardia africana]
METEVTHRSPVCSPGPGRSRNPGDRVAGRPPQPHSATLRDVAGLDPENVSHRRDSGHAPSSGTEHQRTAVRRPHLPVPGPIPRSRPPGSQHGRHPRPPLQLLLLRRESKHQPGQHHSSPRPAQHHRVNGTTARAVRHDRNPVQRDLPTFGPHRGLSPTVQTRDRNIGYDPDDLLTLRPDSIADYDRFLAWITMVVRHYALDFGTGYEPSPLGHLSTTPRSADTAGPLGGQS